MAAWRLLPQGEAPHRRHSHGTALGKGTHTIACALRKCPPGAPRLKRLLLVL